MTEPGITVVVPHIPSRRHYLDLCLGSLAAAAGIEGHEVVLAAERSDDVGEVLAAWEGRLPLRLAQADLGCSSAKRNAAVAIARGRVIAFIDDDAMVAPDYLVEMTRAFDAKPVCTAGAIEPVFEGEIPPDLADAPFRIGGFNRYGGTLRTNAWIGANCAFDAAALRDAGPFDVRLGPGASYLPWGDDEEMFIRMEKRAGVTFAPRVVVRHHIQPERLNSGYVLSRAYKSGRTRCVIDWMHQRDFWRRAGIIPVMWAKARVTAIRRRGSLDARVAVRRLDGYMVQLALLLVRGVPEEGKA